jgi:peptidoglycan hydrolase CwlO-like protein
MSAIKRQLAWLLQGADRTQSAFESYAADLRALQEKVARIDDDVQRLRNDAHADQARVADTAAEVAALRSHLRDAVDDLADRTGLLVQRVDALGDVKEPSD